MTVKDMKTISSFLLGILLLFGLNQAFAAPVCDRSNASNACRIEHKKAQTRNHTDRNLQRSLRRQHTREAYGHDMNKTHGMDDDAPRFHKGKRMTPDERNRLRQQIDEAGQAIYHQ